ncbi:MAG: hypothetical protein ABL971_12340 [Vicinamibacterales bacterium]
MPALEFFTHAPQPPPDTRVWRFRPLKYFRDVIQKREFHFARADQFPQDDEEGIPPDEYVAAVRRLDPYALDRQSTIDNHIGVLAQDREAFFIHCWYRFDEERPSVWKDYAFDRDAQEHGVALCSRYDLLCQAAASFSPRPHVGIVQYGAEHLKGHYNVQQFITTKRKQFESDRELRLGLWHLHPLVGNNRHHDSDNRPHRRPLFDWIDERRQPCFLRQRVDLQSLLTEIIVSPYAPDATRAEVEGLLRDAGLVIPVRDSELRRYAVFLP